MPREYRISNNSETVDVWFTPSAVWEVKGADFQVIIKIFSFLQFIHAESGMQILIEELD